MSLWQAQAACSDDPDPDAWFSTEPELMAHAQAVCASCPVAWDCLGHAVETGQAWGTWGGLTQDQRGAGVLTMDPMEGEDLDQVIKATACEAGQIERHRTSGRTAYPRQRRSARVSGAA